MSERKEEVLAGVGGEVYPPLLFLAVILAVFIIVALIVGRVSIPSFISFLEITFLVGCALWITI
jgi:hypothetical protein